MPTVTYPSPMVPGPPSIDLAVPEGWLQVWVPDTLIAVRDDAQGTDHFLANLVVRHRQRPAPFGESEILAELGEYARSRQQGSVTALPARRLGDREAVGVEVSFVDPQVGPVVQVHWFLVDAGPHALEVLQVTGSTGGSRHEVDGAMIEEILGSMRVTS